MRSIPHLRANNDSTYARPASYPRTLVFHKVQSGFSYGSTNFSPQRFFALIDQFAEAGYRFVLPWEELFDDGALAISFDDGYAHLIEILTGLLKRDIRPTVFMPTAFLGRINSWDYSCRLNPQKHLDRGEVTQLAKMGVEFGSHGHEHIDLTNLNAIELKQELQRSQRSLSDIVGSSVRAISYPFGRINSQVIRAAELAGYTRGFTMRFPSKDDDLMARGRIAIYGFDTPFSVSAKLSDSPIRQVEALKARVTNALSGGTILLNQLRRLAR